MTYGRFERHFDPSLAIDAQIDEPVLLGAVTEVSPEVKKVFGSYESRLAQRIPQIRTKDLDDPAWRSLLTQGYEIVEHAIADGSAKIQTGKALDDITGELRKAFELRKGQGGLKIYPTRGTPLAALGFDGFVAYGRIHVPFEHRLRGEPETGFANVVIQDLPPPDADSTKYHDEIQKAGRDIFREIRHQQQIRELRR